MGCSLPNVGRHWPVRSGAAASAELVYTVQASRALARDLRQNLDPLMVISGNVHGSFGDVLAILRDS